MCEKYSYEIVIIQTDKAHTFYVYVGLAQVCPNCINYGKIWQCGEHTQL